MAATVLTTYRAEDVPEFYSADGSSLAATAICAYFRWLPVLWLCGLMLPAAFLTFFGVFLVYVRSRRAILFALPWCLVGGAQYLSVLVNWAHSREPASVLLKHFLAGYVSGWLLLGAAIGIGASGIVDRTQLLRSIARVSYYSIVFAVPAYVLAFYLRPDSLFLVSPVGHLVPATFASRNFAFGIFIENWEDLGAAFCPRLSLFTPWPTAMGAGGVCMVFIAMNLVKKWERRWCIAGGVLMVIASVGRLSFLALAFCLILRWFLNWKRPYQVCFIWTVVSLTVLLLLLGQRPGGLIDSLMEHFNGARAGASEIRNEVYEANWTGFYKAPIFGQGWPGEALLEDDRVFGQGAAVMVPGSHSTVSGLLYKGGLVTFGVFLFAFVCTVWGILRQKDIGLLKNSLMVVVAIGLTCFGEALESLVLPMIFAFLWIGCSLGTPSFSRRRTTAVESVWG